MNNQKPKLLIDTVSYFDIGSNFVDKVEKSNNGKVILTGIMQRAEVPNQNRRIYPRHILEREVNKLLPLIKDNQIVGSLDHPDSAILEFDNACIKLLDMWWQGNDVMGKVQVLKGHPAGDKVLSLIDNEVKIGISSRSLGTTIPASMTEQYRQYEDCEVVNEDLNLITLDLVSNPSTHGAFLVTENMMLEWSANRINEIPKYSYSKLDKIMMNFIEKYKVI